MPYAVHDPNLYVMRRGNGNALAGLGLLSRGNAPSAFTLAGLGDDTGGSQVDTGGTQPTGQTASPVIQILGTAAALLPTATATILSPAVTQTANTPQSPLPIQAANPLAVSAGAFMPPHAPAVAPPSKVPFILGALLLAGGAWWYFKGRR